MLRLSNEPLATYPVGTIIETTSEVSPAQLYGGTWEEFGKGKVLVGRDTSDSDFNTILKTGGEKQHKLSENEMPGHNHDTLYSNQTYSQLHSGDILNLPNYVTHTNNVQSYGYVTSGYRGGNQPHNNLQPYIVVYRWRRIA